MLTLIGQSSVNKDESEDGDGEGEMGIALVVEKKPTWSPLIFGTKRGSLAAALAVFKSWRWVPHFNEDCQTQTANH